MKTRTILGGVSGKLLQGLGASLIGACIAFFLYFPGWLDRWEAKTWDWRVNLLARPSTATDDIRIILLDQDSLDWALHENSLSWPWPREVYSPVIEFCNRAGARSFLFDVLFTEPSPYGVSDDASLAASFRELPVVGAVFLSRSSGAQKIWPDFTTAHLFDVKGFDPWAAGTNYTPFTRATFPIKELAGDMRVLGNVQMSPDPDNVYRRVTFFGMFDGRVVPSLALGGYLAAQPEKPMKIRPGVFSIGEKHIPINPQGQSILNFRGPSGTHKTYSAASIIQGELLLQGADAQAVEGLNYLLDDFKDAYVLFGFSAPGLYDLRPTPFSGVYPGVEVFATMLDNLLADDFIRPVPVFIVFVLTLVVTLLAGITTSLVTGITRSSLAYLFFICLPVILSLIAYRMGYWLPLAVQEVGVAATLFAAGVIYYNTEGRQKMFIKNAFKHYLSPAIIEQLIAHPERLKLGGERRTLSIFFSDLEGFTSISEGLDPESLTNLLNQYLSAMTDIIHEEGGTVDKYEGDAIIAFWNAPLEQQDHAQRCVSAALKCQARLAEMRPAFHKIVGRDLKMRIGINTGMVVVGNMGSHSRFDYTMIGDAVNVAARLEGINKQFGTGILVSQSTMEAVAGAFPCLEIARVAVVGRREPVLVFEPYRFQDIDADRQATMAAFTKGRNLFYCGAFSRAEAVFSEIAGEYGPSHAYAVKCRELIDHAPEGFHAVWVVTEK